MFNFRPWQQGFRTRVWHLFRNVLYWFNSSLFVYWLINRVLPSNWSLIILIIISWLLTKKSNSWDGVSSIDMAFILNRLWWNDWRAYWKASMRGLLVHFDRSLCDGYFPIFNFACVHWMYTVMKNFGILLPKHSVVKNQLKLSMNKRKFRLKFSKLSSQSQ
jgi:hypothetical protein